MAQLAIKGHATRGKEVIETLKMLGGENTYNNNTGFDIGFYYSIEDGGIRSWERKYGNFEYMYFTLEQFLEKFPYKVGDKVYYDNKICDVIEMLWNSNLNTISYGVYDGKIKNLAIAEELKSYKEETMEGKKLNSNANFLDCSLVEKIELALGNTHEVVVEDGKTFIVRKKPKYPKTYEECCEVLGYSGNYNMILTTDVDNKLFNALYRLKVCRDAWKIAEEKNKSNIDYVICNVGGKIISTNIPNSAYNHILAFPTQGMRDAFYENFKELIEQCKELL